MTFREHISELHSVDIAPLHQAVGRSIEDSLFLPHLKLSRKKILVKGELLGDYINFLNKYIATEAIGRKDLVKLVDFLDYLNHRKAELEIQSGKKDLNNIKKAARHLGKKMQSSV